MRYVAHSDKLGFFRRGEAILKELWLPPTHDTRWLSRATLSGSFHHCQKHHPSDEEWA